MNRSTLLVVQACDMTGNIKPANRGRKAAADLIKSMVVLHQTASLSEGNAEPVLV